MQKISTRLKRADELTANIWEFEFDGAAEYAPGQFFLLEVDEVTSRAYSVAAAGKMQFCVKLIEDGKGSDLLRSLKVGDEVSWKGPMGHFTLGEPDGDEIFVATGVGIAPFMTMLEVLFERGFEREITLYFGVRDESELFYMDRLKAWEAEHSNFRVVTCLSRSGDKKRVTDELRDLEVDGGTDVFICGNGHMVKEVKAMMEEKGLPKEKVHFELFTPATNPA